MEKEMRRVRYRDKFGTSEKYMSIEDYLKLKVAGVKIFKVWRVFETNGGEKE